MSLGARLGKVITACLGCRVTESSAGQQQDARPSDANICYQPDGRANA
jgi:hypothetical protein